MSKKKIEKTAEYIGKSTSGKSFNVHEFTEFLDVTTISDTEPKWFPGMLIYRLPNGDPVNHVEDDIYEIVRTGEKIKLTKTT
jgi:hypothetical protein